MGFMGKIVDFIQFKEFVTPAFFKIIYLAVFAMLNLAGLAMMVIAVVMPVMSAQQNQMVPMLIAGIIAALVIFVMLLFYNLILRMYFEIILLVFNIHGYLKSIDEKTKK